VTQPYTGPVLTCRGCGRARPAGWFRRAGIRRGVPQRASQCRDCRRPADAAHQAHRRGAGVTKAPRGLLARLWARQRGRCGICAGALDPLKFHIDHKVPIARGGAHVEANLQLCHVLCNLKKGSR
jgi:5-methylcytosine-specific restriction endonuclease McrA